MEQVIKTFTIIGKENDYYISKDNGYKCRIWSDKELKTGEQITAVFDVVKKYPFEYRLTNIEPEQFQKAKGIKDKIEAFNKTLNYCNTYDKYYVKGFETLDKLAEELGNEYIKTVEKLKTEKADKADTLYSIYINTKNPDIKERCLNRLPDVIFKNASDYHTSFFTKHSYRPEDIKKISNLVDIIEDIKIKNSKLDQAKSLLEEIFDWTSNAFCITERMTIYQQEIAKKKFKAKYNPEERAWYCTDRKILDFLDMSKISDYELTRYFLAKKEFNDAVTTDKLYELLPKKWNHLKRQYIMAGEDGISWSVGNIRNFTASRSNAEIYIDREEINKALWVVFKDGSHKHMGTYLYARESLESDTWYLIHYTESDYRIWDTLRDRWLQENFII